MPCEEIAVEDDTLPIRAQRLGAASAHLTTAAAAELRRLYEELPDAVDAAGEALGSAGAAPTGLALERFRELDARVVAITDRIKAILGPGR
jgi:hypothetical protein